MHKFNIIYLLGLDPRQTLLDVCQKRDPFFDAYLEKGNYYTTPYFENDFVGEKFDYIMIWNCFNGLNKSGIKRILGMSVDHMH